MDKKEEMEKFQRYEAEFSEYLMGKYFSDKDIYGGNIFDVKTTKDGKILKAGRFPGYASYADPVGYLEQIRSESSSSGAEETPAGTAGRNVSSSSAAPKPPTSSTKRVTKKRT